MEKIRRTFALSAQGARDFLKACLSCVLSNLALMLPVGLLYSLVCEFMVDRSAISEELVRLDSHIAQMREAMDSGQPVGRKLDFIVQELNREVNTISSKSQDIPITQAVVAAKAQIEKLREQVQNVE